MTRSSSRPRTRWASDEGRFYAVIGQIMQIHGRGNFDALHVLFAVGLI